jgi:hypothetical protein
MGWWLSCGVVVARGLDARRRSDQNAVHFNQRDRKAGLNMARARLLLIWLFACAALSAVATASASATPCNKSKTQWVLCNAGGEEITETGLEGTGTKATLETSAVSIQCTGTLKLKTKWIIGIPIVSDGEVEECKVAKPASCTIAKTLKTHTLSGELINTPPTAPEEQLTGEGAKEEFMTVTLEGSECSIKGTFAVTGKQNCKMDSGVETAQETHELICTGAGSKLKLGGLAAKYEGTIKHHITSKASWSVKPN